MLNIQNNQDFVHSIEYTILKRVNDLEMRKKLYFYFTQNKNYINDDLFRTFIQSTESIYRYYNEGNNKPLTQSFTLVLLTYLHESLSIGINGREAVNILINKYLEKYLEASDKFIINTNEFNKIQGYECFLYLAKNMNIFVFNNNPNRTRSPPSPNYETFKNRRSRERFSSTNDSTYNLRRKRSRSDDNRLPKRSVETILAPGVNVNPHSNVLLLQPQQPHQQQPQQQQSQSQQQQSQQQQINNASDTMVFRLVQENRVLHNLLNERDRTISQYADCLRQRDSLIEYLKRQRV